MNDRLDRSYDRTGGQLPSNPLEPIIDYSMTPMEAKAYKISLLWTVLIRREFPGYKSGLLPRGDPRKSLLFKFCYKLAVTTNTLVPDNEYKLYILAQLRVLKQCGDENNHALIHPNCLVGIKAWRRWKMWKRAYDKQTADASRSSVVVDPAGSERVLQKLAETKRFLMGKFGGHLPTREEVEESVSGPQMRDWIVRGQVSPYYVLLEPTLKNVDYERTFKFDPEIYRGSLTPTVREWFDKEFHGHFAKV